MRCISAAADGVSVEDFGKVSVVILRQTHYNRECPIEKGTPIVMRKRVK